MTLAHIRALAEEYAQAYNPDHVAPFPHENVLAKHDDLRIYFVELEDPAVPGVIVHKDGEFTILVDIAKPITWQHITLAHELGHYFLHKDTLRQTQGIVDSDETVDGSNTLHHPDSAAAQQLEDEANSFATSLIMPADLVRRAWEASENVEACARIFTVSVAVMAVRLIRLGILAE